MNHILIFFALFWVLCVDNSFGQFSVDFENKTLDPFFQKCETGDTSIDVEEIQKYNISAPTSGRYALILKNDSSICLQTKNVTISGDYLLEIEYSSAKNNNPKAWMEITVEDSFHRVYPTEGTWITFNIKQKEKTANVVHQISLRSNGTTFLINNISLKKIDVTTTVTTTNQNEVTTTDPVKTEPGIVTEDVTTKLEDVTTTDQNVTATINTEPDDASTIVLSTLKRNEILTENDVTTLQPSATITIAVTTTVEPTTNDAVITSDVTFHQTETEVTSTVTKQPTTIETTVTDNIATSSSEDITVTEQNLTTYSVTINDTVTSSNVVTEQSTVTTVAAVTDSVATSSSDVTVTTNNVTTGPANVTVTTTAVITEQSSSPVNTVSTVADNVTTSAVLTTVSVTTSSNVTGTQQNVTEVVPVTGASLSKAHYCFCKFFYSIMGVIIVFYFI